MRLRVGGKFGSSGDLGDEGQINRARAASSRRRAGGATPAGPLGAASCNSEIRWSKVRAVESRFDAGWFAATSACAWISAVIVAGASATAEVASSGDWRRARLSTRGSGIIAGDADARDVDGRSKPRSLSRRSRHNSDPERHNRRWLIGKTARFAPSCGCGASRARQGLKPALKDDGLGAQPVRPLRGFGIDAPLFLLPGFVESRELIGRLAGQSPARHCKRQDR